MTPLHQIYDQFRHISISLWAWAASPFAASSSMRRTSGDKTMFKGTLAHWRWNEPSENTWAWRKITYTDYSFELSEKKIIQGEIRMARMVLAYVEARTHMTICRRSVWAPYAKAWKWWPACLHDQNAIRGLPSNNHFIWLSSIWIC